MFHCVDGDVSKKKKLILEFVSFIFFHKIMQPLFVLEIKIIRKKKCPQHLNSKS